MSKQEFAKPIEIGADVWVGGGAIICPGVKIGSKTVIGAGSVVTKDVPAGVFTAGNPCRVIRERTGMAKRSTRAGSQNGKKKAPAGAARKAKPAVTAAKRPHAEGVPDSLALRAQVSGEVLIRLRVLDPAYTAKRLARLLNAGNATWEVGDPARYHRIVVGGRVVAQIEQADEDTRWGRYEAD